MKCRRAGNGLSEIRNAIRLARIRLNVIVSARDCRVLADRQARDRLWEFVAQVRVLPASPVTSEPGRVHGKLHQVRETPYLLGTL